jgi:hypothetical protein
MLDKNKTYYGCYIKKRYYKVFFERGTWHSHDTQYTASEKIDEDVLEHSVTTNHFVIITSDEKVWRTYIDVLGIKCKWY